MPAAIILNVQPPHKMTGNSIDDQHPTTTKTNHMNKQADIIVIGAGIAGTSAAAALAGCAKVLVLDQEAQPGYHSTGRSAATWAPFYGPDTIQRLTALSRSTLTSPSKDMGANPFTAPRGEMMLGRAGDEAEIERNKAFGMDALTHEDALKLVPLLKTDSITDILFTDNMLSIDVDALHQAYIKKTKSHGSELICNAKVNALVYENNHWVISTDAANYSAPVVINAAGAWADQIGALAGATNIKLQAKRRSAALIPYAEGTDMSKWPMIFGANETFYCTPFGNGLMVSPADETIVEPHDAWPEDIDIATGIDYFQQHIDYEAATITHKWAGLRNFVADGEPVVGFDPQLGGFFWLAGQGGYGIQTSPALGAFCRALIYPEQQHHNNDLQLSDTDIKELKNSMTPARL